ncbi:heterokaryon incompatibility protein-domain-containing protein [Ilyonectria destructans]|nr:heterokaryon incompatibility protein-domain-containing protein [Ilyonectria destructans]
MIIDPNRKQLSPSETAPSQMIFFEPKLAALLLASPTCQFCQWLIDKWSANSTCNWGDLKKRAGEISLCLQYLSYSFDLLPIVEVTWIGLWDPRQELDERDGRCRIKSRGYLDVVASPGDAASKFVSTRPIKSCIGSYENLTLSRQWIQDCLHNHDRCQKFTLDFMPKRALKLQQNGKDQYHIILHHPSSTNPYTALSYCWGGDQPHKTTKDKVHAGDCVVNWQVLPRSIQDAIKVTIGLGYEYLWVDSLCIVQDGDQEKAQQIAFMPKIYAKAVVTIVASRAQRAVDGFLHEIDTQSATELCVRLPFKCPDSSRSGEVFLTKMRSAGASEPIDYRGWTFQERYLSPRVLDYTSNQLSWNCSTSGENPGYSDGWRVGTRNDDNGLYLGSNFYTQEWNPTTTNTNGCHDAITAWRSIVEVYTKRSLTFPKDRILAISGIAEMFAPVLKDQYIAGHWRQSLPFDLLWFIVPGTALQRRQSEYQAPSWSWAAIMGNIWFNFARAASPSDYEPPKPALSLSDMHTVLEEKTAVFGAVTSGYIRGRGRIRSLVWFGNRETPDHLHVLHDRDSAGNLEPVPLLRIIPDALEDEFSRLPLDTDISIAVHLLHVGTCIGWGLRGLVGLVLREQLSAGRSSSRRKFNRVGVFHINPTIKRKRKALGVPRPSDNLARGDNQDFFESSKQEEFEIN